MTRREGLVQRRDALRLLTGLGILAWPGGRLAAEADDPLPSLKEKYASDFAIGVSLGGNVPADYSPEELALIRGQFAVLTPENCMKMEHVARREGRFDFGQADAFVDFAGKNGFAICGHVLVWARDEHSPKWFFAQGDKPASRDLLLERLRTHIQTLAGRYEGKIASWDVVNEALDDAKEGYLRPSRWLEVAGPEFIAKAFEYAREAAPRALLIYNDYNNEQPAKRAKMLRLLRALLDKHVPVDAVGLQGHFQSGQVPFKALDETLVAIKGLGLKAVISELDIAMVPRDRWFADNGAHRKELSKSDPYKDGCPPERLERQAREYAELFRLFRRHARVIERVTFWNLHDGRSWLNTFPWKHTEYPLLFDRACRPKTAFREVMKAT